MVGELGGEAGGEAEGHEPGEELPGDFERTGDRHGRNIAASAGRDHDQDQSRQLRYGLDPAAEFRLIAATSA
jgi:hypothetical protein